MLVRIKQGKIKKNWVCGTHNHHSATGSCSNYGEKKGGQRGQWEGLQALICSCSSPSSTSGHLGRLSSQCRQALLRCLLKPIHKSYWKLYVCSMVSTNYAAAMALNKASFTSLATPQLPPSPSPHTHQGAPFSPVYRAPPKPGFFPSPGTEWFFWLALSKCEVSEWGHFDWESKGGSHSNISRVQRSLADFR